ncbi:uncharacterized protein LOC116351075 [Contarinia nasturtii]|uniref:uncharacterized protein LOC116351075 n=1 Tax=Contarinia nasturtii TaxID=265458 RepID=UPI0012D3B9FE|nr:uncharacterized protein LOC116351075 [Contarinia nasturtii]
MNNVILPRHLPQKKSSDLHGEELALLSSMVNNIDRLKKWIPLNTVEMFKGFDRVHRTRIPAVVSKEIRDLTPGKTFAMFVRRQNCAIMAHMPSKGNMKSNQSNRVIVSTFPGNLHPKYIYAVDSDIEFNYPIQALDVPFSKLICSEEFADQLCYLYQEITVDKKNRDYVSKWLFTLLADANNETLNPTDFPVITKKIRDETMGTDNTDFFRRSGFYMCTKVLLQHNLTVELGAKRAKILYKLIMIQFLVQMIDYFNMKSCEMLNIDLMSQSLAKLARRIEKMSQLISQTNDEKTIELYELIVDQARATISQIRQKIDKQINQLQTNDEKNAQLTPLKDLNFSEDLCQKIPKLSEYLENRQSKQTSTNRFGSSLQIKPVQRHYLNELIAPDVSKFISTNNEIENHLIWSDFENWILYIVNFTSSSLSAAELCKWSFSYASFAEQFYNGDQLGTSRMILVRLKMIAMLDFIGCTKHQLLLQHRSGINPNIIDSLLLPQQHDMDIAYELECYFKKRNEAHDPSLIEEKNVSIKSFSSKYAELNEEMQVVLEKIKEIEQKGIDTKRTEWTNERARLSKLRLSLPVSCSYYTDYYGVQRHDRYCSRCRIKAEIDSAKITQYERPLPKNGYQQNAIVFELKSPIEITCLRDVLYEFARFCDGEPKKQESIQGNWINYHQIKKLNATQSKHIIHIVQLGSTTGTELQSYHVDTMFDMFVIQNGFNCIFHASNWCLPKPISDLSIKDKCTFVADEDEYKSLQWTLKSTQHTQNEVITRQKECPDTLSLSEFKNFGSLRADGHRLQLRKMYAMIESEALSFEKSSTLSLIIQTLWEAGISGDDDAIRESHADFNDSMFTSAMIEMLVKFCEQQKNNWVHPLKLMMAAFITVRMFEINTDPELVDLLVKVLDQIRTIALNWIEKIEKSINEIQNPNMASEQELRMKLILVAIAGAITFYVHSTHEYFDRIFNDEKRYSASRIWLQFGVTLSNNVLLNAKQTGITSNLRIFLRIVRYTGIHIESKIQSLIQKSPNDIFAFVKKQWNRADSGTFGKLYFYEKSPQICVIEVSIRNVINHVTIDIVTGLFLVNRLPVSRLPTNITNSALFQRIFRNFVFEVQPSTQNVFTAKHKYNECSYEFHRLGNQTIIIEMHNGDEKEVIPHEILINEIPYMLIENYTHFWNKTTNAIEFRPKLFSDDHFSTDAGIEYRLDLDEKRLIHMKTERPLLDINSGSYLKIVEQLSRLESSRYIHILTDKENNRIAKAELVRMQLKFIVDCTDIYKPSDLMSNEYSQMRVSLLQKCGTLYGLHHGLLLESVPSEKSSAADEPEKTLTKLLLMPHGDIQTELSGSHVSVRIDIESELCSPPFHVYQIDDFCRQLKAMNSNYAAWFYLAYLHAVTSHGEVEPFIKMSGTERALQILQSGFAWSSQPYDEEAIKILEKIAQLSPIRKSRVGESKEEWQQVQWPMFIPPHSAQDTFIFIAQRLLDDSQRLLGLYPNSSAHQLKIESNLGYNKRQYLRCLPLMPNLRVSDVFMDHIQLKTSPIDYPQTKVSQETQTIAILYHRGAYKVPNDLNLSQFLKSNRELDGIAHMDSIPSLLKHQNYKTFVNLWISLYEYARTTKLNREQFTLIWSVLTHEENSFAPILALQAIAMNPQQFRSIEPPPIHEYKIHEGSKCDASKITSILNSHHTMPYQYYSEDFERTKYDSKKNTTIERMTNIVTANWPCDKIDLAPHCTIENIQINAASTQISRYLKMWNNNRKLDLFIQDVQQKLQSLNNSIHIQIPHFHSLSFPVAKNWKKYQIEYKQKMCEEIEDFDSVIKEANQIWCGDSSPTRSSDEWWSIYEKIVNGSKSRHLIDARMYPRIVPSTVLPEIASKHANPLKPIIGALAITISHEQRNKRIEIYSKQEQLRGAKEREEENKPHENWKPSKYPEWLLFEIEQNVTIRRVQVKVAEHMMNPTDIGTKHSVMQLNMGEGKTAVIAPIIAALLANGKQAVQITVLKSLFATNLKSLRRYLGGMLGRRMYIMPCRRDMPISQHVSQLMNIYTECKEMKGVILTSPEWRLSFQLKQYESIERLEFEIAAQFVSVQKWINANVRSILDESDAILHAKYQLIYTLGAQLPLDGGADRWNVIQAILKCVPEHMKQLNLKHGPEKVEFDEIYVERGHVFGGHKVNYRADVFTPCRILDPDIYTVLKSYLIEDFLEGRLNLIFPEMQPAAKDGLRHLLTEKNINKEKLDAILKDFSPRERNILMTLSGMLRFEVLKLVLMRRWRVNYGVNDKGNRKMAIPFKAKDVAAELTEFGHPDVALCFTYLSYYYSGLTDDQLKRCFQLLSVSQNADTIYEKWAQSVPTELMDASIRSYTGVNLSDPHQRDDILFPMFRFNMYVIDFYLSKVVFLREAKTFENKLMCTAWDLSSEHMQKNITGFSGTNDTKNILPLPIAQNDLAELESTNEDVRKTLLRDENQLYENLPANVSGLEIIEKLVENEIPVLLDAGALMLELNNQQVAKEWLALASDTFFDAAVYFDASDILQTIDRNGIVTEFDCSVYRENLSRCLVYLDDVHTRGTDLRFPVNWKACVTLSGDITRDKTVQACMRMRQLRKGQSIAFWASFEADVKIQALCANALPHVCVPNDHVIEFICSNSKMFESENTVHWTAGAYNYTKKLIGHKLYENSIDKTSLTELLKICRDDEYVLLEDVYGDKEDALLVKIVQSKFEKLITEFKDKKTVKSFVEKIMCAVHDKIMDLAPNVKRFVQALDEEQEKELEHELEEERNIERPAAMVPARPHFDEKFKELILTGAHPNNLNGLIQRGSITSLHDSLKNTQLIRDYISESKAWSHNILVTKDFTRVLFYESSYCDEYLRPVWWIAYVKIPAQNRYILILLSSFECDRLMATFKQSEQSVLCMFRPRLSKLHDNLLHQTKLQVTGMNGNVPCIDVVDEVNIGIYSGSMYFKNQIEQDAYCNFLGLIPRPRTKELDEAFNAGIIKPNGFVSPEHRQHESIIEYVGECKFNKNPVDLAIKLIEAHHHLIRKESHVESILESGFKMSIADDCNAEN